MPEVLTTIYYAGALFYFYYYLFTVFKNNADVPGSRGIIFCRFDRSLLYYYCFIVFFFFCLYFHCAKNRKTNRIFFFYPNHMYSGEKITIMSHSQQYNYVVHVRLCWYKLNNLRKIYRRAFTQLYKQIRHTVFVRVCLYIYRRRKIDNSEVVFSSSSFYQQAHCVIFYGQL